MATRARLDGDQFARLMPQRPSEQSTKPVNSLLDLQRIVGNSTVTDLIERQRRPLAPIEVQRYEAGEHAQFGAQKGEKEEEFKIGDVKLTYGDLIALGDFYEDMDQIRSAPQEELKQLVDLIHRDKRHFKGEPGVAAVTNDEWQKATEGRKWKPWRPPLYLDLAGKNESHFAVENRKKWVKFHTEALRAAQKGDMPLALATNGFADHFLTDAFSAGHLVEKSKMVNDTKANLAKTDPKIFAKLVAINLLEHPRARAELSQYQVSPAPWSTEWKEVDSESLAEVVEFIRDWKEDKYYSMFVRAVHDKLNQDIEHGTGGVLVENRLGRRWRLSGDETLGKSPETLEIAQAAVAQSKSNVYQASNEKQVDFNEAIQLVWNYVPTPVDEGEALVTGSEATLTDPKNPATAPAIAQIAVDNLAMLIDELSSAHMLRQKPGVKLPAERPGDFELPSPAFRPA
jgi:hypothetical protein